MAKNTKTQNNFINEWDHDDTDGNSMSTKSTIFSSKTDRLFYIYGDINARNCADIAYDISQLNYEDDEKEDLKNIREKKKDTYFSAKEAKELKIIDSIIKFG